jgi:hypothetical protein
MKILFVAVLLNCFALLGQNPSYKLFNDEIFPTAEKDYQKAKAIYVIYQKKYSFDPNYIRLFLDYSLKNKDVKFFKKEIKILIKNYGFSYSSEDTLKSKFEDTFYSGIYDLDLHHWLISASRKYYPKWMSKHPDAIEYERLISLLHTRDQLIRGLSFKYHDVYNQICKENVYDTLLIKRVNQIYNSKFDKIFYSTDCENIKKIASTFLKNNKMITNFDCFNFGNHVNFIVFHNFKGGVNLDETWNSLHIYFEQAYIDGFDSGRFFRSYDYYLNLYQGLQYYGTLGENIPLKDPETFKERKERLKL